MNVTVPKLASGSGWQLPSCVHDDGASAIHSALEVSGLLICSVLLTEPPVVWSDSPIVTSVPLTLTSAEMWSPGRIVRPNLTGAEGTSSYQA